MEDTLMEATRHHAEYASLGEDDDGEQGDPDQQDSVTVLCFKTLF